MRKKFTFWNSTKGNVIPMDKNIFEVQRFVTISNSAKNTVVTGTAYADSSSTNITNPATVENSTGINI